MRLGEAALDPALWPAIIEDISAAAGATGAVLLQSDVRTPDVPRTASVRDMMDHYFAAGWHTRDLRAERAIPLLKCGAKVVVDQDIVRPAEMRSSAYYNDAVMPFGFRWFAGIGFSAGPALWALVIQRTPGEGPFGHNDKHALGALAQQLSEVATFSTALGRKTLSAVTDALGLLDRPAIALDRFGRVLDMNAAAERVFDDEIRIKNPRLHLCDPEADSALAAALERMRAAPETITSPLPPIVVSRRTKPPLVIRLLPIPDAARSPFLGACALLVISDLGQPSAAPADLLARTFGLSRAETRLAALIATGVSPEQAADQLGLARETVRNQLKAIFVKTKTHRQSELVALLSRL